MLKIRIIPCLDVADGRIVKGVNFVDLRDAGDPVGAARAYDAAGADELCFLDIHATHENRGVMLDVVRRTAEACFIPLTVGGGVRTPEDVRALLLAGADKVSFNSAAVARPEVVGEAAARFGSQCIVVVTSPAASTRTIPSSSCAWAGCAKSATPSARVHRNRVMSCLHCLGPIRRHTLACRAICP